MRPGQSLITPPPSPEERPGARVDGGWARRETRPRGIGNNALPAGQTSGSSFLRRFWEGGSSAASSGAGLTGESDYPIARPRVLGDPRSELHLNLDLSLRSIC